VTNTYQPSAKRVAFAFLVAPLAPILLFFVLPIFRLPAYSHALAVMVYTYPLTLVVGLPMYLLLERLRWRRLDVYLGLTFALAYGASWFLYVRHIALPDQFLRFSILSGIFGLTYAAEAGVFWAIVFGKHLRAPPQEDG
jgi:hypothetical protein